MYAAVGATRMLNASERAAQWARAVASLKAGAAYAAERSVRLAIEPLNRFETDLINTVDQGLKLLADIGAKNAGLLLDTFHMNIEAALHPPSGAPPAISSNSTPAPTTAARPARITCHGARSRTPCTMLVTRVRW